MTRAYANVSRVGKEMIAPANRVPLVRNLQISQVLEIWLIRMPFAVDGVHVTPIAVAAYVIPALVDLIAVNQNAPMIVTTMVSALAWDKLRN